MRPGFIQPPEGMNSVVVVCAALVVVALALGGLNYYTYSTLNTRLSNDKAALTSQINSDNATLFVQINSLRETVSSMSTELSQVQQSESSDSGQISTLQTDLNSVNNQLTTLSNQLGTSTLQLQNLTASVKSLKAKFDALFPQVPLTALVITGDTYDSATHTFTFQVENTQNITTYTQLSATIEDQSCQTFGTGYQYYYISGIYTFEPKGTLSVPLDLELSSGAVPGSCYGIDLAIVQFILPQSTAISLTYDFTVSPAYYLQ